MRLPITVPAIWELRHIDIYSVLITKPHNPHYLSRYYKFILACKTANVNLIKRKKNSKPGIGHYMDSHHICPKAKDLFPEYKSFKENPWNRVDLTTKQHYIAHMILWKAYGGSQKRAFNMMSIINGYKIINSRLFESLKNQIREEGMPQETKDKIGLGNKGKIVSQETRNKQAAGNKGQKRSKETCDKIKKARALQIISYEHKKAMLNGRRGKKNTKEHNDKVSKALKGNPKLTAPRPNKRGKAVSAEALINIRAGAATRVGIPLSDEHVAKISKKLTGRKQNIKTCPFCNLSGGATLITRYHFMNCKYQSIFTFYILNLLLLDPQLLMLLLRANA